ncbi:hypothetical protein ACFLQ5_00370, partial [Bacteroidota bacterium]
MKKEERKELVQELVQKNTKKFQKIINFLEDNKEYNETYQKKYVLSTISQQKNPVEKMWALFVSALNAGRSNNLSNTETSINKFIEIIEPLKDKNEFTSNEFFNNCDRIRKD